MNLYDANSKDEFHDGLMTIFRDDSLPMFKNQLIAMANGDGVFQGENINYTLGGKRLHVSVRFAVAPGHEKTLDKVYVCVLNITDRRKAEIAHQRSEEQLRLFVEHVPAPIAMFDREMRYIAHSQRWMTEYKLGDQDIIGKSHYDVFPDTPDHWKKIHQECLKGVVRSSEEDRYERADGGLDWIAWDIHPWRDHDGKTGGIVMFTEVITERKHIEQERQAHQEHLQTLASELSLAEERERRQDCG